MVVVASVLLAESIAVAPFLEVAGGGDGFLRLDAGTKKLSRVRLDILRFGFVKMRRNKATRRQQEDVQI